MSTDAYTDLDEQQATETEVRLLTDDELRDGSGISTSTEASLVLALWALIVVCAGACAALSVSSTPPAAAAFVAVAAFGLVVTGRLISVRRRLRVLEAEGQRAP